MAGVQTFKAAVPNLYGAADLLGGTGSVCRGWGTFMLAGGCVTLVGGLATLTHNMSTMRVCGGVEIHLCVPVPGSPQIGTGLCTGGWGPLL